MFRSSAFRQAALQDPARPLERVDVEAELQRVVPVRDEHRLVTAQRGRDVVGLVADDFVLKLLLEAQCSSLASAEVALRVQWPGGAAASMSGDGSTASLYMSGPRVTFRYQRPRAGSCRTCRRRRRARPLPADRAAFAASPAAC